MFCWLINLSRSEKFILITLFLDLLPINNLIKIEKIDYYLQSNLKTKINPKRS